MSQIHGTGLEFVENGAAPELFAHGLQSVDVLGSTVRFTLFTYRKSAGGIFYKETAFSCLMPMEHIGAAVALTINTTCATLTGPTYLNARSLAQH